jgi:hypothetical protein
MVQISKIGGTIIQRSTLALKGVDCEIQLVEDYSLSEERKVVQGKEHREMGVAP